MNFGTNGCMYNCGDSCTGECIETIKPMSKQTAVQWLFNELWDKPKDKFEWHALLDKALAMDKEQSISDYCEGFMASGEGWNGEYGLENGLDVAGEIGAEDYYNKTYGGDK